jgi:hypothetical protein
MKLMKEPVYGFKISNHLLGDLVVRVWDQEVCSPMVSGSSAIVTNMMATGGLHGC